MEKFTLDCVELWHGDCLEVLSCMPDNSVDSIVTDPPYGLSFMGRKWDYDVPAVEVWAECLRVLKPGGHLLAFAGTRTQHRMACRIEDGGLEIRDMLAWIYGTGFPKSLDVSKAIDKAAGVRREVVGVNPTFRPNTRENCADGFRDRRTEANLTSASTDAAKQWSGWGTALKPALEPITLARKPLIGTIAANVLAHGTGALNIDRCRVAGESTLRIKKGGSNQFPHEDDAWKPKTVQVGSDAGRWPANLIHDGSDEVLAAFPPSDSGKPSMLPRGTRAGGFGNVGAANGSNVPSGPQYGDTGSAARFFYCAKASRVDRDEGMPGGQRANTHPTVKPTDLMRYLCRLVTPPGGIVLDPFMGSGSTGKAAALEGFRFVGIERELEYFYIAKARISWAEKADEPTHQEQGVFL